MKPIQTDEFINEFLNYPAYDNIRKIGSVIDGLKNSSRKVIYYCLKHNIPKPVKTAQFKAEVENKTCYLHGDITGVVETLAKDYCGANNINLLEPHGNFGTRQVPQSSASRYTFTKPSDALYQLFDKDDLAILTRQYFEGDEIEPVYLMPILPLILINGSEGISSGFAQKIFNRDPVKIKEAIKKKLSNKRGFVYNEPPWYRGFNGEIEPGSESNKWIIKGVAVQENTTQVTITELPVGYSLQQYIKVLDKLEEQGVIRSYKDLSEDDFKFEVKFTRDRLSQCETNDDLLQTLKLVSNVSENYTCQDEHNRVTVFESTDQIIDHFIKVRLEFLAKKIQHKLDIFKDKLNLLTERKRFIQMVIDDKIVINKRTKVNIITQLIKYDFGEIDGSYDYLLNMNLLSLSEDRINKLESEIREIEQHVTYYAESTPDSLYLDELKTL